jgi:hypothetical protein
MFVRGHKPGSRVVRDARLRPLLEPDDEIVREVLGDYIHRDCATRTIGVRPMLQAHAGTHFYEACFYFATAPDSSSTC